MKVICFECSNLYKMSIKEYEVPKGMIKHCRYIRCKHYGSMDMIPRLKCPYFEVKEK